MASDKMHLHNINAKFTFSDDREKNVCRYNLDVGLMKVIKLSDHDPANTTKYQLNHSTHKSCYLNILLIISNK